MGIDPTAAVASSFTYEHFIGLLCRLPHGWPPTDGQFFLFRETETIGVAFKHLHSPPSVASVASSSPSRIGVVLPVSWIAILRRWHWLRWRSLLPTASATTQTEFGGGFCHCTFHDGSSTGQERYGFADACLERRNGRERSRSQLYGHRRRNTWTAGIFYHRKSPRRGHHYMCLNGWSNFFHVLFYFLIYCLLQCVDTN